jgi:hypothetical protein
VKTTAFCFSVVFFAVVLFGAFRTVLERHFPFIRKYDDETRQAYVVLVLVAAGLFGWARLDIHVESVEIAGVKATVGQLQQKVETLSSQMEMFFKNKRIEIFNKKNWDRVRKVSKPGESIALEVSLDQEPIPGSVEVYEGVLLMPEQKYHVDGRVIQFPANADTPVDGITVKYYPRLPSLSN